MYLEENMAEVKSIMLNEFKTQITKIFNRFFNDEISLNECINAINGLMWAWDFTRIDIKNIGLPSNTIRFLEIDRDVRVSFPDWFNFGNGVGCVLQWPNNNVHFLFSCVGDGELKIYLKGVDFRDIDNKRVPIYVNFQKMIVNERVDFEKDTLVWHDQQYVFEKISEDGQVFFIDLKYRTLFDYFPQLKINVSPQADYDELYQIYLKINDFIKTEEIFI